MTGASIAGAARTAALLAAEASAESITMSYAVHGLSRQYQREARVLRPTDLGRHAVLLDTPMSELGSRSLPSDLRDSELARR